MAAPLSLFQIWIEPKSYGIDPRYEEKAFNPKGRDDAWQLLVSNDGREDSLSIHQDAFISLGRFQTGTVFSYTLRIPGNIAFVMVVEGKASIDGHTLSRRDAIGLSGVESFGGTQSESGEIMVIEIPS